MPGLQLPYLMQKPAFSDTALHYPLKTSQSNLSQGAAAVKGNSYPHFVDPFLPSSKVAPYSRPLTPPPDMNGPHRGIYSNHGEYPRSAASSSSGAYNQLGHVGGYGASNTAYSSSNAAGRPASRPQSPNWQRSSSNMFDQGQRRKASSSNAIVPHLQIPPWINNSKGSLSEFATQITCLFWFESSLTLQRVEASQTSPLPATPLVPDAIPTTGFRKWVTTILATTQVTQNVVLLALLFIYRLKQLNPTVKGKPGSEFRLLTVALMLGNKFLDDNTYTNKTWAEVSGISVQEIHVMEVEFLSNMRYSLYTSEEEWRQWHVKLDRFWEYFERASRTLSRTYGSSVPPIHIPPPLPSPPASTNASPPFTASYSPDSSLHNTPQSVASYSSSQTSASANPALGPLQEFDTRLNGRKRSHDEQSFEPPHKRLARSVPYQQNTPSDILSPMTFTGPMTHVPKLPPLNPSVTSQAARDQRGHSNAQLPPFNVPQLPPPNVQPPAVVFPPSVTWSQPAQVQPTIASSGPSGNLFLNHQVGSQSRRPSPYPTSRGSSPSLSSFGPSSAHLQPQQNMSPSFILSQRTSPYRPVRSVNILNVPQPLTSISNLGQNLGYNQMHYQPLGRPINERKSGVLPYIHHGNWQEPHQISQWPTYHQPMSLKG